MGRVKCIITQELARYSKPSTKVSLTDWVDSSFFDLDASEIDPLDVNSSLIQVKYSQEQFEQ